MNVGQWISKRAVTDPGRPFLTDEDGGMRSFDNREFNRRTNRMAHALASVGVKKGDRVSVLMLNSSEFLEIFFACAKIGAILVPINYRLAAPEIAYMVNDSSPTVLVYSADFSDKVAEVKPQTNAVSAWFRPQRGRALRGSGHHALCRGLSRRRAGPDGGSDRGRSAADHVYLRHHRRPQGRRPHAQ